MLYVQQRKRCGRWGGTKGSWKSIKSHALLLVAVVSRNLATSLENERAKW